MGGDGGCELSRGKPRRSRNETVSKGRSENSLPCPAFVLLLALIKKKRTNY